MREITKRLLQMSNKLSYEDRETKRRSLIKQSLIDTIAEIDDLNLKQISNDPSLIHEHDIFSEWIYSYDIYLFFDVDILEAVNDFFSEWGAFGDHETYTTEVNWILLIHTYIDNIVYENINQWAEEEAERAATNETR